MRRIISNLTEIKNIKIVKNHFIHLNALFSLVILPILIHDTCNGLQALKVRKEVNKKRQETAKARESVTMDVSMSLVEGINAPPASPDWTSVMDKVYISHVIIIYLYKS